MDIPRDGHKDRVEIHNWSDILMVPEASTPVPRNLITNFGQVSAANCKAHALTFNALETSDTQNNVMLYYFLVYFLTTEACRIVLPTKTSCHLVVAGVPPAPDENVPSGVLLLKEIIGHSSIYITNAKVLLLRFEIANLPYKMIELKGDIKEFKLYAFHKRDELLCCGQSVKELIAHLFQSYYLRSPDENFAQYLQSKKDKFEEDGSLTPEELMSFTQVKYELIIQQTAAVSEGEERIIAMRATVNPNEESAQVARFVAMEAQV